MASTAASLVDPIKTEYQEVIKAEGSALPHAIKCGELLAIAKETIKKDKGDWKNWREVNCPEIAQETASLYMRLAEHKDAILKKKARSIREANEVVREINKNKPRGNPTPRESQADTPEPKHKPTPADELKDLAPDEVCMMLVHAGWDDDQLQKLQEHIATYLRRKKLPGLSPEISNTVAKSSEARRRV